MTAPSSQFVPLSPSTRQWPMKKNPLRKLRLMVKKPSTQEVKKHSMTPPRSRPLLAIASTPPDMDLIYVDTESTASSDSDIVWAVSPSSDEDGWENWADFLPNQTAEAEETTLVESPRLKEEKNQLDDLIRQEPCLSMSLPQAGLGEMEEQQNAPARKPFFRSPRSKVEFSPPSRTTLQLCDHSSSSNSSDHQEDLWSDFAARVKDEDISSLRAENQILRHQLDLWIAMGPVRAENEDRGPSCYESVYPLVERLQDQVNALNMELEETKQNLETIKAAHDQKQHEVEVLKEEKKYSQHHFGVVQNAYGFTKDAWKWGKNVPVLSDVLGLTEGVTERLLDMIVHMDLTAIDQDIFSPNMKRLDDDVITPALRSICEVTLAAQNEERKQLEENMRQLFSENLELKSSNKDLAVKLNGLAAVARLRIMQQKLEAQTPAGKGGEESI
jgi:hypothetical protein